MCIQVEPGFGACAKLNKFSSWREFDGTWCEFHEAPEGRGCVTRQRALIEHQHVEDNGPEDIDSEGVEIAPRIDAIANAY